MLCRVCSTHIQTLPQAYSSLDPSAVVGTEEDASARLLCPVRGLAPANDSDIPCQACATLVAQDWDAHGYKLFGRSHCAGRLRPNKCQGFRIFCTALHGVYRSSSCGSVTSAYFHTATLSRFAVDGMMDRVRERKLKITLRHWCGECSWEGEGQEAWRESGTPLTVSKDLNLKARINE